MSDEATPAEEGDVDNDFVTDPIDPDEEEDEDEDDDD